MYKVVDSFGETLRWFPKKEQAQEFIVLRGRTRDWKVLPVRKNTFKRTFIFLLGILIVSSCSTIKEITSVNPPEKGAKVTYDLKKGKVTTKYKLNKIITLKY